MLSLRKTACYGNGDVGKSGKAFRLVRRRRYPTAAMAAMDCAQAVLQSVYARVSRTSPISSHQRNLLPKVIVCK